MLTRGCLKLSQTVQARIEQQDATSLRGQGHNTRTRRGRGQTSMSAARVTKSVGKGETNIGGGTPVVGRVGSIKNEDGSTLHPLPLHPPEFQPDEDFEGAGGDNDETQESSHTTVPETCRLVSDADSCSSKICLDPKGLWFKHSRVKREITKVLKQHYTGPWFCWSETPKHVKDQWYCAFKEMYTWDPTFEEQARKGFEEGGTDRLKDMRYKAQRRRDDKPPKWMPMEIFKKLKERALDPKFKERSERARRNRKSGGDKVQGGHCIGSISLHELAERMAAENNGVFPTAAQIYTRSHSKTTPEGKTIFYGKKAEETMAKYEERQQLYESQNIIKNPNEVYYEVVGGHNKGVVPGLGTSANLFYEKTPRPSTSKYVPSVVSILEEQLTQQRQEYERVAKELEDQKSKTTQLEEQFQLQQQQMSVMNQQFEAFSQYLHQRCGNKTSHPPKTSASEISKNGAPQSPDSLLQLSKACEQAEKRGPGISLRKKRRQN